MVKRRQGFTLAEVIVALLLMGVATLSLAGAAALGRHALRESIAETRALLAAGSVLDSLVRLRTPAPGARVVGPDSVAWTVTPDGAALRIDVTVRYRDGSAVRALALTGAAAPAPPRLHHDR